MRGQGKRTGGEFLFCFRGIGGVSGKKNAFYLAYRFGYFLLAIEAICLAAKNILSVPTVLSYLLRYGFSTLAAIVSSFISFRSFTLGNDRRLLIG